MPYRGGAGDEAQLIKFQDRYRGYWVGGTPDLKKLKKLPRGTHIFFVEWFSQNVPSKDDRLPPQLKPEEPQLRQRTKYISLRDAQEWRINPEEAQETAKKLYDPNAEYAKLAKVIIQF